MGVVGRHGYGEWETHERLRAKADLVTLHFENSQNVEAVNGRCRAEAAF
jgi:hypothetical protein